MPAIYGHRWTSAYGERCDRDDGGLTVAGDTWAKGLTGVTGKQMAAGLNAALVSADPWPPTLPQFRAMCLGVPTLAATRIALRKSDPSPFAALVWRNLDNYRLRHADADKADRLIRDAYAVAREYVMAGGELPEVAGRIEPPKPEPVKRASRETAEHNLATMMGMTGIAA